MHCLYFFLDPPSEMRKWIFTAESQILQLSSLNAVVRVDGIFILALRSIARECLLRRLPLMRDWNWEIMQLVRKFQTFRSERKKRTTYGGSPQFHLNFNPNFWIFWLNGKHPLTKRAILKNSIAGSILIGFKNTKEFVS